MDLPKKYKANEIEEHWKDYWKENGTYDWDPTRGRDETFVVDTPPPTVSGSLHVGHLFSYSHQDFIVRYQRMRGKNIFFPIGWDDNGLPTERRVQNLYNVKCDPHAKHDPDFKRDRGTKGEPLPISRTNFIELCDEVAAEDEEAFKHLWTRLGLSYDWDQEYATIDKHCRLTSQKSFIDLLEKGECYQDETPVMWDVDFQTAIAQAEVTDKERPSAFQFLRFGIQDADDYLVIATTRPELLAACVAVLVHPEDDRYQNYIGKNAVTPLFKVPVPIMSDPKADPEKGTGVVMVCTFGDQTDVEWWRDLKLPLRQIIGRDGHLLPIEFVDVNDVDTAGSDTYLCHTEDGREVVVPFGASRVVPSLDPTGANQVYQEISGKYTKQAQKRIIGIAEATEGVIDRPKEDITHAVKFFEKGDRPLELIPTRQWYTKIMDKKEVLIAQGHKIKWHPEFMGKRYELWVEGLNQDWCMSRQRYFGVPIPIWFGIDENGEVDYEKRMLPGFEQLPVDPLIDVPDGYTEDQRNKPGGFTGDPDVLDTWATSSLTPQIASKWAVDTDRHQKLFPMDIRPQSHEIIRTWAFYTIVKAYLHENEIPWRNVVISGWILDPDRKKMSKSQGNVVTPEPLIDQFGADSVRYWAARARLGVDTAYDEQVFKVGKRLATKLFNASKFAIGRFSDIDPDKLGLDKITTEVDRAVVQRLRDLSLRVIDAFEVFDYAQALSLTEEFFWQTFCDNYLELAKPRTYDEELTEGRISAASTLRLIHRAMVRMFAPFMPYLSEEVWQWCYSGDADMHESVHRSPWPCTDELADIPKPSDVLVYDAAIAVVEAVRKAKADANKSMKAPVQKVTVTGEAKTLETLKLALDDIERMLHISEVDLKEGTVETGLVSVQTEMAE